MEEKDLLKLIQEQSEDVEIPESLKPENVVKKLEREEKKKKSLRYKKFVGLAACCAVVVGIGVASMQGFFSGGQEEVPRVASLNQPERMLEIEEVSKLVKADDYSQLYSYFEKEQSAQKARMQEREIVEEAFMEEKSADVVSVTDFSDTNVREEGVAEGDFVKTDGKYMYVVQGQQVNIIDLTQDTLEQVATIDLPQDTWCSELFVKDGRLVIVYVRTEVTEEKGEDRVSCLEYTEADTYDVSDPTDPKKIGTVSQSGYYNSMRIVDGYGYLISMFNPMTNVLRKEDVKTYIPSVQGKVVSQEDIFIPAADRANGYTIVSSFALANPEEKVSSKAVMGYSDQLYVSRGNIYFCENHYSYEKGASNSTCIRKISYKDGDLNAIGQIEVEGSLNDSFSIDEYEGNLRLVTTTYVNDEGVVPLDDTGAEVAEVEVVQDEVAEEPEANESNTLYIFDENLNKLSSIENIAQGEQVYSARFMGAVGYFVTFKQVDPLFSVDLSDPRNPRIIGELKIPGFSEYLHPYGEGRLLGIGCDVDETGTVTNGVKLSMYDISNPSDVQEVQKHVLKDVYSTDVGYNYKAAFVSVEKNMIGFVGYGEQVKYYIFCYDENGFQQIFERDLMGLSSDTRAFYVGDRFYLVAGNVIESYTLDTFEKIDDIVL